MPRTVESSRPSGQPGEVHRPGMMRGAQKPHGMAAAWMVWIEIRPNRFWSAESQIRHRQDAYDGSVAAGLIWC
jgi:hypothetical protein